MESTKWLILAYWYKLQPCPDKDSYNVNYIQSSLVYSHTLDFESCGTYQALTEAQQSSACRLMFSLITFLDVTTFKMVLQQPKYVEYLDINIPPEATKCLKDNFIFGNSAQGTFLYTQTSLEREEA